MNRDCRIDSSDSNIAATVFTTLKIARQIFEHSEIEKNTLIGFDLQQLIFKKFEQKWCMNQFVWKNKTKSSISLTLVFFVTTSFSLQIINCRKPRAKKHPSLNGYCKFKIAVEAGCQKPQGLSRTCPHPFCIGSMYVQCTHLAITLVKFHTFYPTNYFSIDFTFTCWTELLFYYLSCPHPFWIGSMYVHQVLYTCKVLYS